MDDYDLFWTIAASCVNLPFLIDMVLNIAGYGFKKTFKNWEYVLEIILQCLAWFFAGFFLDEIIHQNNFLQERLIDFQCLLLIARNMRLLNYMYELKDFKMIVQTFQRFSVPFASMMLTLYTVMFFFAIIGLFWFNGHITESAVSRMAADVDYMYVMMSFNDFYAAMVTLFQISVENNWNNTTAMYVDAMGSKWPRVYFVTYWLLTTMILLNIIISFVLEIYTTVGEDIQNNHVKLQYAKQLMDMFKNDDEFIEYLQDVLNIGFMGNSVVHPSATDMRATLVSRGSGVDPTLQGTIPRANSGQRTTISGGGGINQSGLTSSNVTNSILKKSKIGEQQQTSNSLSNSDHFVFQ